MDLAAEAAARTTRGRDIWRTLRCEAVREVSVSTEEAEEAATPLVEEVEEEATPLVEEAATPLVEEAEEAATPLVEEDDEAATPLVSPACRRLRLAAGGPSTSSRRRLGLSGQRSWVVER